MFVKHLRNHQNMLIGGTANLQKIDCEKQLGIQNPICIKQAVICAQPWGKKSSLMPRV
jgi:hypothetical protein